MSRQGLQPQQRSLTLTEELEKLEQSITLTLQEIDHNFSRAHRIVTTSILPILEQYAEHSKDVWEGSTFWKQFFESSANVSLSGYEEQPTVHETVDETTTEESGVSHSTLETSESYETPAAQHLSTDSMQDLDLSNLTMSPSSHSTPRPSKQNNGNRHGNPPTHTDLEGDLDDSYAPSPVAQSQARQNPRTPVKQTSSLLDDIAMTPEVSPEAERRAAHMAQASAAKKNADPLLHRVLDKNYRIQATPLTSKKFDSYTSRTPHTAARGRRALETLDSSPVIAPPQLTANIYDSPVRKASPQKQRTPGVSVLTPRPNKSARSPIPRQTPGVWDSDEDDEINEATGMPFGASPPKTMQFHIPQSRLLKTPAREASRQIVDNILASAGVRRHGDDDDLSDEIDIDIEIDLDDHGLDDNSPSVVRMAEGLEDETF